MDPHVGVLHDLDYGRPSLALDLLDEFRHPLVDRLVLSLINRRVLQQRHFEDRGERGVLLNEEGRPLFLQFYYRAVEASFQAADAGGTTSYRELFHTQARKMRAAIESDVPYVPFVAASRAGVSEAASRTPDAAEPLDE